MEFFDTTITEEAKQNVIGVLNSKHVSEGEVVSRFEQELGNTFGYEFNVATNSCTSALHLSLILAGVGQGDEVILPAQTFVATGLSVLHCGAKCVFADIGMDGNISVDSVSTKITRKTKAVISVAWGGNPPNLQSLEDLCDANHLKLIQDNAHALGAIYNGLPISYFGDFSCFSFQAIKQLTTGDGGLLVCRDYNDYKHARKLRWFGIDREHDLPDETGERKYNLNQVGYKYHMNDFSAALGLGNLAGINDRQFRRQDIATDYDTFMLGTPLKRSQGSSNWLYTRWVDDRNGFIQKMKKRNVPASVVHVGIDRNSIFNSYTDLPMQREWDAHHVCLPCHSGLSNSDVRKVIGAYNECR